MNAAAGLVIVMLAAALIAIVAIVLVALERDRTNSRIERQTMLRAFISAQMSEDPDAIATLRQMERDARAAQELELRVMTTRDDDRDDLRRLREREVVDVHGQTITPTGL